MRLLELFSGTANLSAVAWERDWDTRAVDILHGEDVARWVPTDSYDLVWASPPCDTYQDTPWHQKPPDTRLWRHARRIIGDARPAWYCIENVRGAQRTWGKADQHCGSRYLWTNLPPVRCPVKCHGKWRLPPTPDRPMLRSRLPSVLCHAVLAAVEALPEAERRPDVANPDDPERDLPDRHGSP